MLKFIGTGAVKDRRVESRHLRYCNNNNDRSRPTPHTNHRRLEGNRPSTVPIGPDRTGCRPFHRRMVPYPVIAFRAPSFDPRRDRSILHPTSFTKRASTVVSRPPKIGECLAERRTALHFQDRPRRPPANERQRRPFSDLWKRALAIAAIQPIDSVRARWSGLTVFDRRRLAPAPPHRGPY